MTWTVRGAIAAATLGLLVGCGGGGGGAADELPTDPDTGGIDTPTDPTPSDPAPQDPGNALFSLSVDEASIVQMPRGKETYITVRANRVDSERAGNISLSIDGAPYGVGAGGDLLIEKGSDTARVRLLAYMGTADAISTLQVSGTVIGANPPAVATTSVQVAPSVLGGEPRNSQECAAQWTERLAGMSFGTQEVAGWKGYSRIRQGAFSYMPDSTYSDWSLEFTVVKGEQVPSLRDIRERIVMIGTPGSTDDRSGRAEILYSGTETAGECWVSTELDAFGSLSGKRSYTLKEWKQGNGDGVPDELVVESIERKIFSSADYALTLRRANLPAAPTP